MQSLKDAKKPAPQARNKQTWGGWRPGAGRKPTGAKAGVAHVPRPIFSKVTPLLVTMRLAPRVGNLRSARTFPVIAACVQASQEGFGVQVVSFAVEKDQLHLLVEAPHTEALCQAMKGFSVRLARGLNKFLSTKAGAKSKAKGQIMADRYEAFLLATSKELDVCLGSLRAFQKEHTSELGARKGSTADPYVQMIKTDVLPMKPRTALLRKAL